MARPIFLACNGIVAALDTETGREVWRRSLGGAFSATALADVNIYEWDRKVFAGSRGHLFCLSGYDGAVLWQNDLAGFGYDDVSMLVAGERLIVASNGLCAAFDPQTGRELWRRALGSGLVDATIGKDVTLLEWQGRIFAGCGGNLICLRLEDGAQLWSNGLSGMGFDDVTLTIEGRTVQFLTTVDRRS